MTCFWVVHCRCVLQASFFISLMTYQVYANMTRFEWAYPSGIEDVRNQWISGSTMILVRSVHCYHCRCDGYHERLSFATAG